MKRTSKKIMKMYSILLASAMILGLSACGNSDKEAKKVNEVIAASTEDESDNSELQSVEAAETAEEK